MARFRHLHAPLSLEHHDQYHNHGQTFANQHHIG